MNANVVSRAQGCLLGQLAGDALGSLVEFRAPEEIRHDYPKGLRRLSDGGTWDTIAGQPTDDSEMALMLARVLVSQGRYAPEAARNAYVYWLESQPFDCGETVLSGLRGRPNPQSQANGALMRISPLGIFGARYELRQVAQWAREDAALTHPNPICLQANALFAMAISHAISAGVNSEELFDRIETWSEELHVEQSLLESIEGARSAPPNDYVRQQGWVLTGFRNALWQVLHAPNLEEGVVDTVMRGGDTDTNGAIAGALLGAVYGLEAIPEHWVRCLLNCRPRAGQRDVHQPRPECFWPVDALQLAEQLVAQNCS